MIKNKKMKYWKAYLFAAFIYIVGFVGLYVWLKSPNHIAHIIGFVIYVILIAGPSVSYWVNYLKK